MKHCDKMAVTVNTTNICNMRCKYCMASSNEEQINPISISLEFAKSGIYDAINGFPTGIKAKSLRFFSPGEPTQRIDIMRECVNYARLLNPLITFELQTNGLFESDEDTKWISDNFNSVWFSLDGPAEVNDLNRPDKFGNGKTKEIEKNMKIVSEKTFVGVRSTVDEEVLYKQDTIIEYYYNLGIKYVCLNPLIRAIKRNDKCKFDVTKSDLNKFAYGFTNAYKKAIELDMIVSSSLTFNFDEPTKVSCRSCIPMPQLNPDGSVSSCDMALYSDTKEELKCFIYGQWDKNNKKIIYDMDKIKYLQNRNLTNLSKCQNCKVKDYCAGGCAGRVAYQTGDIFDVIPEYCSAIKFLAGRMKLGEKKVLHTHP